MKLLPDPIYMDEDWPEGSYGAAMAELETKLRALPWPLFWHKRRALYILRDARRRNLDELEGRIRVAATNLGTLRG